MALIFEILSGALVGGAMEDKHAANNWGCLVAAIDPALFGDAASFSQRVQQVVKRVKQAKKEEEGQDIFLPGERGFNEASKDPGAAWIISAEKSTSKETSILTIFRPILQACAPLSLCQSNKLGSRS